MGYICCKNENKLQIAYEWSMDETVYVDYKHHSYVMCLHHVESSFTTSRCM
jgi:hypothetical protein